MTVDQGLTFAQIRELTHGPDPSIPTAFEDENERRLAWHLQAGHVFAMSGPNPWALIEYGDPEQVFVPKCLTCGEELPPRQPGKNGRPKKYCSKACYPEYGPYPRRKKVAA